MFSSFALFSFVLFCRFIQCALVRLPRTSTVGHLEQKLIKGSCNPAHWKSMRPMIHNLYKKCIILSRKPRLLGSRRCYYFLHPHKTTTERKQQQQKKHRQHRQKQEPIMRRVIHISLDFPSDHGRGGKGEKAPFCYQNTL